MSGAGLRNEELLLLDPIWQSYFPGEAFTPNDGRVGVVAVLRHFFETAGRELLPNGDGDGNGAAMSAPSHVNIDFEKLCQLAPIGDFQTALHHQPKDVLGCLGIAMALVLRRSPTEPLQYMAPRLLDAKPKVSFNTIKSNIIGRLINIQGNVIRVGPSKPLVQSCHFMCPKCGTSIYQKFEDGVFEMPMSCPTTKCYSKYFELRRETAVTIDYQLVKIQEIDTEHSDPGRVPRTLEVELREDLVDFCIPGDVVSVTGIVKTHLLENARSGRARPGQAPRQSALHQLYLEANAVQNLRSSSSRSVGNRSDATIFSQQDYSVIRELAFTPGCFELLVASLCPAICGHELVKAGMLLALFGGTVRDTSGDKLSVRSDIHMLVVGDPGLGKSQMLRSCATIAPLAIFVSGNTTTTTGLTVTMSKEGGKGDLGLEAGALVLADRGVCCIDEFDKMSFDQHALLEAMEQQQISIAKSGVVTALSSRCAILAAANPVGGHYNRQKTVCENLKMPAALLSRFDLVFILLDKPDEARDRMISSHIMRIHNASATQETGPIGTENAAIIPSTREEMTLTQRLKRTSDAIVNHVPYDILRKYISYARQYCHPKITAPAAKILQKLYLTMRAEASAGQSIPVTTRHLESLVRLAQARAKLELREHVTAEDAQDVVQMLQESLLETFTTETGEMDFGRKGGMSLAKQVKAFVAAMNKEAELRGTALFQLKELQELVVRTGIKVLDLDNFLEVLRSECYLLKKGAKLYQLQTSILTQHGV